MKPLNMWSEIEIKAAIYDRQNEIAILQNELRVRASQPAESVVKSDSNKDNPDALRKEKKK